MRRVSCFLITRTSPKAGLLLVWKSVLDKTSSFSPSYLNVQRPNLTYHDHQTL